MRGRVGLGATGGAAACVAAACLATACAPAPDAPPSAREEALVGAAPVAPCGWSGTALLSDGASLCSGVLVHPRVVVYAGHCGTGFTSVRFGADGSSLRAFDVARCVAHPDCGDVCRGTSFVAGDPWDYAVCVLATPAVGAAPVPPAMGCELDDVTVDARGTVVGFGLDESGSPGVKRELVMRLSSRDDGRNQLVWSPLTPEAGLCAGDSGGPTFVELPDRSWRVASVHHGRDDPCGRAFDRQLAPAVPWIERETGIDVTPCHDAAGRWSPTAQCRDMPRDPGGDHGVFPDCEAGPRLAGLGASCGAPYVPPSDGGAPTDGGGAATDGGRVVGEAGVFVPPPLVSNAPIRGGCAAGGPAGAPSAALAALAALAVVLRRRGRHRAVTERHSRVA